MKHMETEFEAIREDLTILFNTALREVVESLGERVRFLDWFTVNADINIAIEEALVSEDVEVETA